MKKSNVQGTLSSLQTTLLSRLWPGGLRPGPVAAALGALVICGALVAGGMNTGRDEELRNLEAGMVADRDIIAEEEISYEDENGQVIKTISRGRQVIKKGFVITEEDMKALNVLKTSLPGGDIRVLFANLLTLLFLFVFLLYFGGERTVGRPLRDPEIYVVTVLAGLYVGGSVFVKNPVLQNAGWPVSIVIPTALIVMLPAILISARLALMLAFVLPLGAFFSGSFDMSACFFALVSGIAASCMLRHAEKRMDLVKAGLFIAAANCLAALTMLLFQRTPFAVYPMALFWAAFNGLASGMMVVGVLPPLEHALNALTPFRLIELSDLNSPTLRRLFNVAPGTYSHSLMVANLAEAACLDIGADPLLARVGAYYHDIGKMDHPDYFTENQNSGNRHDDMSPMLSAAVIRDHVKLGVEKARALGMPREVVDIIAEHHGNSVIKYFYSKALKEEGNVDADDFRYPGTPPRSRESGVVMLADITEAGVRSMKEHTVPKMEKFIQELFDNKEQEGQLSQSGLAFRDLETIKNAFIRVLAGYYHSRIEYPKVKVPRANA